MLYFHAALKVKSYAVASACALYANSILPAHDSGAAPVLNATFIHSLDTLVTDDCTGLTTQSYK